MAYEYSELVAQAKSWANNVLTNAWATEAELKNLLEYEARTPDTLFATSASRPLIVAFLGGTGVGKSTLLNRLAGKAVARTGVIRPTSKEVTLFHHESVNIAQLPKNLPIEKIKIALHTEESKKDIIWIDMPDFDSTEKSNQDLVLEWIPHIDILVYVVSPERYRDNKAWQLLLAEGGKHAWVFVLNQADRAQAEQYQDFIKQLEKAGFKEPIVYQTSCAEQKEASQVDEFDALQATIQSLANSNSISQLEARGLQVRKQELSQALTTGVLHLGPAEVTEDVIKFWQDQFQELDGLLTETMALPMQQLAEHYATHTGDVSAKKIAGNIVPAIQHSLWDQWAQARFEDALDRLIYHADQLNLPITPIKQTILPVRTEAEKIIEQKTLPAVRKALIKPGNIVQRVVIKMASFLEVVLPIAAMTWVGYQVFTEFYESSLEQVPHYLGVDFAINSVLLVAISWLFPWFIKKKLKPSIEKAALKGLKRGFAIALQTLEFEVMEAIKQNAQNQDNLRIEAQNIISVCNEVGQVADVPVNGDLERMLL
ncbi:MAG: hypothetical protein methR_P2698 [Methyloprofundus sp.]|nr:MAG: hypothetical protein methR_P2698 [Methyloprofundus sp.]